MKKDALQEYAAVGVRYKLLQIEAQLRELFREFPDQFASETPPVLVRPDRKPNGNDWPVFPLPSPTERPISKTRAAQRAFWTPAKRAQAAQRLKQRMAVRPWGTAGWHRVVDYLLTQPAHTAHFKAILSEADIATESSFRSLVDLRPELFVNAGSGLWRLTSIEAADAARGPRETTISKPANKSSLAAWGSKAWQRAHDYLKGQPNRTAQIKDILKGAHIVGQPTFISGIKNHPELFARVGKSGSGQYRLKKVHPHD